jgi:peptidyl-prolyl cis-trans isomerase D
MFNLFRSREKMTRYLLGAMMLILAASMLTYLTNTGLNVTTDNGTLLAEIGDQKIMTDEVVSGVDRLVKAGQLSAQAQDVYLPQFANQLIQERAAVYQFKEMGMTVTDEEVLNGMASVYPQLFENGKLVSKEALEQTFQQNGMTLESGIEAMRRALLSRKVQNVSLTGIVVSPKEVDDLLTQRHTKVKIEYLDFPAAKFRAGSDPTLEEMQSFFKGNQPQFMTPELRTFGVLLVEQAKIAATLTIPEAQLRQAYSSNMDNFRSPERVKVRHILVMTQGKPDGEKNNLLKKAQDLLKQVKSGADFAELAKKNSEDPGSAQNGGDLGYIVRGQTVPEFEKFAFAGKAKDISDVVTTQYGYHIIQVLEHEAAKVKPFEEVKDALTEQLKKDGVAEKTQTVAEQARVALAKNPAGGPEIAKQLGIQYIATEKAAPGTAISGIGVSPEIEGALAAMKPKDVSSVLTLPADRLAITTLISKIDRKPSTFDEVKEDIRQRMATGNMQKKASQSAREAAERMSKGESIDAVAKAYGLTVNKPAEFGAPDSVEGIGPAVTVRDAFVKPIGTTIGPIGVVGREIVYKVVNRTAPNLAEYASERETLRFQIKQQKAQTQYELLMDSAVAQLQSEKKLKIYQDNLIRLSNSFRQSR